MKFVPNFDMVLIRPLSKENTKKLEADIKFSGELIVFGRIEAGPTKKLATETLTGAWTEPEDDFEVGDLIVFDISNFEPLIIKKKAYLVGDSADILGKVILD